MIELFKQRNGFAPNLDNPTRYTEKVLLRKLGPRNQLFKDLAHKIRSKGIAKAKGVDPVPIIEPDLLQLPFVMKPAGWSGKTRIIRTTQDYYAAQKGLSRLGRYGQGKGEWWYDFPNEVFCEKYLEDFIEVKFFCFHGKARYIYLIDGERRSWFTRKGDYINVRCDKYESGTKSLPDISGMIEAADRLSEGIDHVRVDLYKNEKVWFGEFTMAHRSGHVQFSDGFDEELGRWW